jgi:coatomer protein complex subunit epsilon
MSEPDELYTLRNLFWIGNFQGAINEATSLGRIPPALIKEKEEFVYRSYLALGQYHIITGEVKDAPNTPINHLSVKLLATYMANPAQAQNREGVMLQLQEWLADGNASQNPTLQLIAAMLYMHEDNLKDAIKCIHKTCNLEQHALLVQIYLRMHRVDLAEKQIRSMKAVDEDSTLTALATAWVYLAMGGAKVQEAAYLYDELIDKHTGTCMLLNGLAVAKMSGGHWEEAETLLQEALTKAQADADSLANLICCSQHLNRAPEVIARYMAQLRSKAPGHPLLQSLVVFEGAFDRVITTLVK